MPSAWPLSSEYGTAHKRQSRPYSGLGCQVQVHKAFLVVAYSLGGGERKNAGRWGSNLNVGHFTEMYCGTEAGSYLRRIDSCISQLKAQGPSRTCNESKEEEEEQARTDTPHAAGPASYKHGRECTPRHLNPELNTKI